MQIDAKDLAETAEKMIRKYGEDAVLMASLRADQAIERGDPAGERLWLNIIAKIEELQAK